MITESQMIAVAAIILCTIAMVLIIKYDRRDEHGKSRSNKKGT